MDSTGLPIGLPTGLRRDRRGGFTLIELLVVIAIIALLIGILLPALGRARASAKTMLSLSNVRQITVALSTYANDYDGDYPPNINSIADENGNPGIYWYELPRIGQYLPQQQDNDGGPGSTISETVGGGVMISPNHPDAGRSYTMNYFASSAVNVNAGGRPIGPVKTVNGVQMRGFDSTAVYGSSMFLIADAWAPNGVETDEGDVVWFTNSAMGAAGSVGPGQMFGAGAGVRDFPGNWTGGGRGGVGRSPELEPVGEPNSYVPYYRYPGRRSEQFKLEGSACFGFADGHADVINVTDLIDLQTENSLYTVRWTAEDDQVERD
ncbi:MAG: type II secretion system protein [Phycisphaerales bacterium]